jgi:DNA-binding response OmpR family regulator
MSHLISNITPNILLVEDDQPLREVLGEILRREGYSVDEAISGEQALLMARNKNYQVVLLDLLFKTTGLQGLSVLKRLQLRFPDLPVIVLSGRASDEMVIQTIREGGFSFLTKPIHDLQNVLLLIKKAVETKQQGDFSTQLQTAEFLVKGAPVDIHTYVYEYLEQFSTYLKMVKGVQSSISIESHFDDLHVFVHAEKSKETVLSWFKEYLGYAENGTPRTLPFLSVLSWEEQMAYQNTLEKSVNTLRHQTGKALRRYYIDPSFGHDLSPYLVHFNPIKVINQVGLQQVRPTISVGLMNYDEVESEVLGCLSAQKTIRGINQLLQFTEAASLQSAFVLAKELQERYEQAVNVQISGEKTEHDLEHDILEIHRLIREELLPAIQKQLHLLRA